MVETVDQERPGTLAPDQVGAMFDRIAGVYDPLNSIMSMGLHRQWTRRAADLARVSPGERALDVATGTGDLAIELATRVSPGGEVVGCDFSAQMLARAHTKAPRIRFELADALALPYADGEFDAATCAYGVRNYDEPEQGHRRPASHSHFCSPIRIAAASVRPHRRSRL